MPPKPDDANQEIEPEQNAAPRHRALFSANALRILSVNVVFGLLIGFGVYAASERTAILALIGFSGIGGISGAGDMATAKDSPSRGPTLTGAADLAQDDPVRHFSETRVGHLLFTAMGSDRCQRVLFNNRTGVSYDAPSLFCGQPASPVLDVTPPNRLQALRATFQR